MLTDVLTHSFTQHMTHPPYAYSYMLIPCLLIDYKAPIVLLPIPYKSCLLPFFLYLKSCASLGMYIKPLELRGAQVESPHQ